VNTLPLFIDLENCNLEMELYVGYLTMQHELSHRQRWMKKIQKKIATNECRGGSIKGIVMHLIAKMKYHEKILAALDDDKADSFYRRAYQEKGGIVCPNMFTTGDCDKLMKEAREDIERTKAKYSFYY
jgi:hypothetical protein